jgi:hypothetical protein
VVARADWMRDLAVRLTVAVGGPVRGCLAAGCRSAPVNLIDHSVDQMLKLHFFGDVPCVRLWRFVA